MKCNHETGNAPKTIKTSEELLNEALGIGKSDMDEADIYEQQPNDDRDHDPEDETDEEEYEWPGLDPEDD